ncbi:MAG TPA: SDR family NAD(P)-dependent oxidoreductase [Acidimicrobiia bacterium]|nr:SDR family NAD(P)-dependent oxidoreductase [Acidimicrobiia bacterium]
MTDSMRPGIALVTGGGQGIGAAICRRLGQDGFDVFVNDLDKDRAVAVAQGIVDQGGSAHPAVADVTDSTAVDAMFDAIEDSAGMVTALVNNAGVGGNAAVRHVTDDHWDRVLSIDLDGVLYCTRRALAPMREARTGSVVTVSSRAWLGWWGQSAYAAAKAGVIGMTRALAVEMSSRDVRLNVVAPGLIETPLLLSHDQATFERLLQSVPLGRVGSPDDVAGAVSFLVSEAAGVITGQVLYVCGGKSVYAYPDWSN